MNFYRLVNRDRREVISPFSNHFSSFESAQEHTWESMETMQGSSPFETTLNSHMVPSAQACETVTTILTRLKSLSYDDIPDMIRTLHTLGCVFWFTCHQSCNLLQPSKPILWIEECEEIVIRKKSMTKYVKFLNGIFGTSLTRHALDLQNQLLKFSQSPEAKKYLPARINITATETLPVWLRSYLYDYTFPSVNLDNPPSYMRPLPGSLKQWKGFLAFIWLDRISNLYSDTFRMNEHIHAGQLYEATKPLSLARHKLFVALQSAWWQHAGWVFAHQQFSKHIKPKIAEHCEFIRNTCVHAFTDSHALQPSSKTELIAKLKKMKFHIGWPDLPPKKPSIAPSADNNFDENVLLGNVYCFDDLYRGHNPWKEMGSYTVNAWYVTECNELYLPCGMFQEPFIDLNLETPALQLSELTRVICHEIAHAFDSQGKHIDSRGYLRSFWTSADELNYQGDVDRLLKYYKRMHCNSKLSLSENIADILAIHLNWVIFSTSNPTNDQIDVFFKHFAHSQYSIETPRFKKFSRANDPHAPSELRCNLVLSTLKAWREYYEQKELRYTPRWLTLMI